MMPNNMDMVNKNNEKGGYLKEPDRYLPIANITRIMKSLLPNNAKVARDAKDITKECVSEFIGLITCEASEKCLREKRKTITGEDILWALATLGFENYLDPLNLFLLKYRAAVSKNDHGETLEEEEGCVESGHNSSLSSSTNNKINFDSVKNDACIISEEDIEDALSPTNKKLAYDLL